MIYRPVCVLLLTLLLQTQVLSQGDWSLTDAIDGGEKKLPASTPKPLPPVRGTPRGVSDFNLEDALDPSNDLDTRNDKKKQGGGFSDQDLEDVSKDKNYKPDKGKGGRINSDTSQSDQYDDNNGAATTAEVGTIAGIASAVCMALVGAISSYISYQKKKLCFSIQQSLNVDLTKTENPEAVVSTEPQEPSGATKC